MNTPTRQLTMEEILQRQRNKREIKHRSKIDFIDLDSEDEFSISITPKRTRTAVVEKKQNSQVSKSVSKLSLSRKRQVSESSRNYGSEDCGVELDRDGKISESLNPYFNNNTNEAESFSNFSTHTAVKNSSFVTPTKNRLSHFTSPARRIQQRTPSSASKKSDSPFKHNKIRTPSPSSKSASNLKQTKLYSPQSKDVITSNRSVKLVNTSTEMAAKTNKKLFVDKIDDDEKPSCSKQCISSVEEFPALGDLDHLDSEINSHSSYRGQGSMNNSQPGSKRLKLSLKSRRPLYSSPSSHDSLFGENVQLAEASNDFSSLMVNITGIPSIKVEPGVSFHLSLNSSENVSNQPQRHLRFLKKIPSIFEDIKAQFIPLSVDNRVKSEHPDLQLSPVIRRKLGFDKGSSHEEMITKNMPENGSEESQRLAYYWSNFLEISKAVLDTPDDRRLFNDDDIETVRKYYTSSENAQQLYARLYVRRHKWLPNSVIKYPEIAPNLESNLDELVAMNYLDGVDHLTDLETALNLLNFQDIRKLCNSCNVKCETTKVKNISALLENCSKHLPLFDGASGETERLNNLLKRTKKILGRCFRVTDKPRSIFRRLMMLYSLSDTHLDSKQNENQPAQLINLMHVNMGKLAFPSYEIQRRSVIFRNRSDLIRYEVAFTLESDILTLIEEKKWKEAHNLCDAALTLHKSLMADDEILAHDDNLPDFLRPYTAGHLLTRCLNNRVDILQKLKRHEEANNQLEELLQQTVYCQYYRGHWVDRFALNAHQHLNQPLKALKVIESAQTDSLITEDHLLSLSARVERIRSSKKVDPIVFEKINIFKIPVVEEIVINGQKLNSSVKGLKSTFYYEKYNDNSEDVEVEICSVEQFALLKYRELDYPKGLHAEGSLLVSLFGLIFWDIIYSSGIPDAFRSPHQAFPLDLTSDYFFTNRQIEIERRFEYLSKSSAEKVVALVSKNWKDNEGLVSIVSWNSLNCDDVMSLVSCIGNDCLSKVFRRLVKNFRHCRSGLPDLTVWNPDTKMWKMVEVKGPGDKLSDKQIIWLNFLTSIGVSAEVCYVREYGGKKMGNLAKNTM
ncbi:Fanconi-associated nuclease 1 [Chamberlinius hualienensis]